ncbi:MAG: divalent-cation tolerance protein CutA [Opitutaceae bacterium]|nr:divalent-cation tolerance protein CutA [Opitutaceae bacterium]
MIGWTTTASREEAEGLGRGLVEAGLVACAQINGPVTSIYRWDGAVETAQEFRLTLKFASARQHEVGTWLHAHHSYQTPQWVCISADSVSKNYLNWVMQTST